MYTDECHTNKKTKFVVVRSTIGYSYDVIISSGFYITVLYRRCEFIRI